MRSVSRAWIALAWVVVASVASGESLIVRYDDAAAQLTVRIHRVPLDEVLEAVSRETGVTIEGTPLDRRDVSKHFDAVPLGQALKRIVGRQNFVLRYGADGAPRRLELLGAPLSPVPAKQPARERGMNAIRLLLLQPPVAVPPRTARVLGGARLPLPRVLAGLRNDDPFVRDECAKAVVGSIEGSTSVLEAVDRLDARQLVDFVSAQAGGHAADAAARLYRAAHDPRLKRKLSVVIAAMHRAVG